MLVTGANGRVGQLLRRVWIGPDAPDQTVRWQSRKGLESGTVHWDFNTDAPKDWPQNATILHLAGVTNGDHDQMQVNVALAQSLLGVLQRTGARHVLFASTVAVYRPEGKVLTESADTEPLFAYGQSKLQAERVLAHGLGRLGIGLTCLRIANVAGADSLLGGAARQTGETVALDPVRDQPAGPERSYIGPRTLARVLAVLCDRAPDLPGVINVAQPGTVAMGDLLTAKGAPWQFGPARPGVVPRVVVDTARLQAIMPVAPASPTGLVAELASLTGIWP